MNAARVYGNARAGVVSVGGAGTIRSSTITGNRFGMVVERSPDLVLADGTSIEANAEQDKLTDQSFSIPDQPVPIP